MKSYATVGSADNESAVNAESLSAPPTVLLLTNFRLPMPQAPSRWHAFATSNHAVFSADSGIEVDGAEKG